MDKKLYRSTNDRVFLGLCAVLENFSWDKPIGFPMIFFSQGLDF